MASGDVYLTAVPTESAVNGTFVSDNSLAVTPLKSNSTMFYVVRHGDYTSQESTPYRLTVTTSQGIISIPQLSSTLMLNGRDSKIHVTDYDVGGTNMLYASAEIFTW
jgi:beta-galactosidase